MNRSEMAEFFWRMEAEERGWIIEPGQQWQGNKHKYVMVCPAGHRREITSSDFMQGYGCAVCVRRDPNTAEHQFRERICALGGRPVYDQWRGTQKPHHVICIAGHDCYPYPSSVRDGSGICRVCVGLDPHTAEQGFRQRIIALGGRVVYDQWKGADKPHHVICFAGHNCYPRPSDVKRGQGICRTCVGQDPNAAEEKFREHIIAQNGIPAYDGWHGSLQPHHVVCSAGHDCYPTPNNTRRDGFRCGKCEGLSHDILYVVKSERTVKFGISSGTGLSRLAAHRTDGLTQEVRLFTDLPEGEARKTENLVKSALHEAGWKPVKGTEYFDIAALGLVLDVIDGAMTLLQIENQVYDWSQITPEAFA